MNMFPNAGTPRAGTGANCNFDSSPYVGLFPKQKNDNVFATFAVQIAPQLQIFGEGLWNQNKVTETYQPSPVRYGFLSTDTAFTGSGVDQALLIYPANPSYPSAWLTSHGLSAMNGRVLAVSARTFLTGPRTEEDKNTQTRGVLGIKGTARDWDYEIAGTWDKSKSEGGVIDGYFSQLGLARIINTTGNTTGTYWNPWAPAGVQNSALTTALQGIKYVGPTATSEQTLKAIDAKASGTLREMAAGPLALAAGVGARKEKYNTIVPDILLQGDIAGLGGATLTQNGDRQTTFAFAEVNVPITRTFEANLSGRVDHYDDLKKDKSPVTGKLSLRWNPTQQLLFRGNVGKGFRAPSLGELHTPQSLGTSEQFVDPLFAAAGPVQSNALIGGAPDLKPEKSKQYSIGAVFSPVPAVTLRADFWRIRIDNYIITPSALAMVNAARAGGFLYRPGEVIFAPDGEVDTVDERLANAASADFRGFDVGGQVRAQTAFGRLALDYNGTYYTKADLTTLVGVEHNIGTIVDESGNALALAAGGGVLLRYKHVVSLNWTSGAWGATATQNYWAGYRTGDNQVDGARHDVNPFETYDLQGEFTGIKHVKLAIGAKNIFDRNPHLYIPAANYFQAGYDPSIYDPRARFIYGRITVSFR
jgi:iron complex outermembrane receptor protein